MTSPHSPPVGPLFGSQHSSQSHIGLKKSGRDATSGFVIRNPGSAGLTDKCLYPCSYCRPPFLTFPKKTMSLSDDQIKLNKPLKFPEEETGTAVCLSL